MQQRWQSSLIYLAARLLFAVLFDIRCRLADSDLSDDSLIALPKFFDARVGGSPSFAASLNPTDELASGWRIRFLLVLVQAVAPFIGDKASAQGCWHCRLRIKSQSRLLTCGADESEESVKRSDIRKPAHYISALPLAHSDGDFEEEVGPTAQNPWMS